MKKYYGYQWTYGSNVTPDNGVCVEFSSSEERDRWVAKGASFVGPGERTNISPAKARESDPVKWEDTDEYKDIGWTEA